MPQFVAPPLHGIEHLTPQEAADRELVALLRGSPAVRELLDARDAAAGAERDRLHAELRDAAARDEADRPALVAEADRLAESYRVVAQVAHNALVLAESAALAIEQHDIAAANARDSILRRLRATCPAEIHDAQRAIRDAIEAARGEFRSWKQPTGECDLASGARIMAHQSNGGEIGERVEVLRRASDAIEQLATSPESPAAIRERVREILKSANVSIEAEVK